jgi:acyl-CoA synthetase (AMP-forming)/AMP-acid ligase II
MAGAVTTLADLLFASESLGESHDIVATDDVAKITRGELEATADELASMLVDEGVAPGSTVAVRLDDGWRVVAALFGVWRAGCVYVPVNPRLTGEETERLYAAAMPAAVVTTASSGLHVQRTGDDGPPFDGDIALIQMTSGTTGRPKPVLLRHSGVLELIDGVLNKLRGSSPGGSPRDRAMPNLIPVSLSLWAGIYNVLFAFRAGSPVVIMNRFRPARFAELVRNHEIRSTVLPPAAMTMLTDDPDVDDLSPLRFVRSITAPLSPIQARRFHDKFGIAVLNSYGQTEIGGEIVGWNAADSREFGASKLGAVGRPHRGVEVRVDADTGELQVRTPAMSAGYADGNDLSDRITDDGWFRTGDIGRVDDDGFVWIEGRVSDVINRGGLKVFPAEVEEVLRLAPGITDVAVTSRGDARLGEVPIAFVVLESGVTLDEAAVDAFCRAHVAPYKVPVAYEIVTELPRNHVGKVLTRELGSG